MKKLLIYLREYKKESILGPMFKLLEALFELLVPLVMAAIIDHGIAGHDQRYIIRMGLILVGFGVVGLLCSITAQYFAAVASAGFIKRVKHVLFEHLQSLSFSELDELGTSTMITRLTSDMNQLQAGVNLTLRLALRSPFVVFGAMLMAFTIDFQAALIFAVVIPLLMLVVFAIMLTCLPLYRKVQQKLDRVLGLTRENLTGVRVLRAFRKENEEIARFTARNAELTKMQKQVGKISALMNPLTYILINLGIIGLIWVGALQVEAGIITQGAVIALYNYMTQMLIELVKLANLIITITKAVACGNRIQDALAVQPSLKPLLPIETTAETDYIVEFRHVSMSYRQAKARALSDISFTVKRGQMIGIIGGTGAGKSTLINLLPRFYEATEGLVLVDGLNVQSYDFLALRDRIGMVMQKAVLFKGSIRDNMRWGKADATDEEICEALRVAQIETVVEQKGGLDFQISQGGKNLSGGQRQRLTIARALVKKPDILILDDSSSALDYATDSALRKAISAMEKHPTVFVVSQRAASIRNADQIIVLDDGRLAGIGTAAELLENCAVYQEIHLSQFRKEDQHYVQA